VRWGAGALVIILFVLINMLWYSEIIYSGKYKTIGVWTRCKLCAIIMSNNNLLGIYIVTVLIRVAFWSPIYLKLSLDKTKTYTVLNN